MRRLTFAIEVALLVIIFMVILAHAYESHGVMAHYGIDIASVTPDKDFRCERELQDGKEVGRPRCSGHLTIVWRAGSGRIEVVK